MAEQTSLFGEHPAAWAPEGTGWQAIPKGKHGGYRRRSRGGWEYTYPPHAPRPGYHPPIATQGNQLADAVERQRAHKVPIVVSYGAGVDSTGLLVGMHQRGIRPDAVVFADVGGENPATYAYLSVINEWLLKVDFPPLTIVRRKPTVSTSGARSTGARYATLEQQCLELKTLPSLAFGGRCKSCSSKWKHSPQDQWANNWEPAQEAWKEGFKVTKLIGYSADPADERRPDYPDDDKFAYQYPLRQWGWTRAKIAEEIQAAGLPVPAKSSCVFCPSVKPDELRGIIRDNPDLGRRIIRMEAAAEPFLTSIAGLWRKPVMGARGGTKKPGTMSEWIVGEELLPEFQGQKIVDPWWRREGKQKPTNVGFKPTQVVGLVRPAAVSDSPLEALSGMRATEVTRRRATPGAQTEFGKSMTDQAWELLKSWHEGEGMRLILPAELCKAEQLGLTFDAPKPPAGFTPIPGSKHGGYHKREGVRFVYWYPDTGLVHSPRPTESHEVHGQYHAGIASDMGDLGQVPANHPRFSEYEAHVLAAHAHASARRNPAYSQTAHEATAAAASGDKKEIERIKQMFAHGAKPPEVREPTVGMTMAAVEAGKAARVAAREKNIVSGRMKSVSKKLSDRGWSVMSSGPTYRTYSNFKGKNTRLDKQADGKWKMSGDYSGEFESLDLAREGMLIAIDPKVRPYKVNREGVPDPTTKSMAAAWFHSLLNPTLVIPAELCKAEQFGLFEGIGAPKPPGSGWASIPKGKHGGYRRRKGAGWEYWYPTHGLMDRPHPDEPPEVHAEHNEALRAAGEGPGPGTRDMVRRAMASIGGELGEYVEPTHAEGWVGILHKLRAAAELGRGESRQVLGAFNTLHRFLWASRPVPKLDVPEPKPATSEPPPKTLGQKYRYGMFFRPPGFGGVPTGYVDVEKHEKFRHGVVVYDHPLTAAEIKSYELTPMVPRQQIVETLADDFRENADAWLELHDEDPKQFAIGVGQRFEQLGLWPDKGGFDRDEMTRQVVDKLRAEVKPATPEPPPKVATPAAEPLKLTVQTGEAEAKGRRFETAGKKIGGSRADLAAMRMEDLEANPQLARTLVTKANVLGIWKPAWADADRENGVSPICAYAKKLIFDSVAGKPYDDPGIRDAYRQGCTRLLDGLSRCKDTGDINDFLEEWRDLAKGQKVSPHRFRPGPFTPEALREVVARQPLNSPEEKYDDLYRKWKWENHSPWLQREMLNKAGLVGWREFADGTVAPLVPLEGKKDQSLYKLYTGALGNRFAGLVGHGVRMRYGQPQLVEQYSHGKVNTKERKAFDQEVNAMGAQEDPWAWVDVLKGAKAAEKVPKPQMESENREDSTWVWTRRTEPVERKGPPVPPPEDSVAFMKAFGLPGVEYGKWANDAEREWHVTSAHAGLHDLAEVLGIPPSKVGIAERLSLAFGARGSGGKRAPVAHYEPGRQVINMTKLNGAGSLAHEWGHFLDNAVMMAGAKAVGSTSGKAKYLSEMVEYSGKEDPAVARAISQEVIAGMHEVMQTIKFQPDTRTEEEKAAKRVELSEKMDSLHSEIKIEDQLIKQLYRWKNPGWPAHELPPDLRDPDPAVRVKKVSERVDQVIAGRNKLAFEYNAVLAEKRALRDPQMTEHYAAAKKLAGGSYYCRDVELWARAFESYVEDKLIEKGRKSGYLVHGTAEPSGHRPKAGGLTKHGEEVGIYMEPGSDHRKRTNEAIEKFIAALHRTDSFSKAFAWSAWLKSILDIPLVIPE